MKKNIFKYALFVLITIALIFFIGGMFIKDIWTVEEKIIINTSKKNIYQQIADLKNWQKWSVWTKDKDPTQKYTYEDNKWSWESEKMGSGYLLITDSNEDYGIKYDLFIDMNGNKSLMHGTLQYKDSADGLEVTWIDQGDSQNSIFKKWLSLVIKSMLKKEFKEGLTNLKNLLEY